VTGAQNVEHAHLSILCEIRGLLYHQLGMTNDEIANLFEQWYNDKASTVDHNQAHSDIQSDKLRGNFLIGIGFKGLRFKEGDGIKDDRGIVEGIEDKVTQDVDLSEVSSGPVCPVLVLTYRVLEPGRQGYISSFVLDQGLMSRK